MCFFQSCFENFINILHYRPEQYGSWVLTLETLDNILRTHLTRMLPIAILSGSKNARVFNEKEGDHLYAKEKCIRTFTCFYSGAVEALTCEKFNFADRVAGCLHATMAACVYTPYIHVIHDRVRVNVSFYNASAVVLRCTSMSF